MIDDDIVASKRGIRLRKLLPILYLFIYFSIFIVPLGWLVVSRAGITGDIALAVSVVLSALLVAALLRRGEWLVRRTVGAVSADPVLYGELESLGEDISLATGRPFPDLMVIQDRECCNLFSMKRRGRAVIFVGRGALERLAPDELRVAIGHEMAHIHNGDAEINTLTVFFRALYDLGWLRAAKWQASSVAWTILFVLGLLGVVVLGLSLSSEDAAVLILAVALPFLLLFLFDQVLSVFLPYVLAKRDLLADELAVKWTLEPESLISAMRKAEMHDTTDCILCMGDITFVPAQARKPRRLREEASIDSRIDNIEDIARLMRE